MRGKDEKLLDIFNSNGKRFIIPAYQFAVTISRSTTKAIGSEWRNITPSGVRRSTMCWFRMFVTT